jgi:hypothetical protein
MSSRSALKVYKNANKDLIIKSLKAMVDNINMISFDAGIPGLCRLSGWLSINILSAFEYEVLRHYLYNNLPYGIEDGYCWKKYAIAPRKNWLIKQIELLENGE